MVKRIPTSKKSVLNKKLGLKNKKASQLNAAEEKKVIMELAARAGIIKENDL
jgi:hypothetical protein